MTEKNNDIWEKVYHTDARVTAMEGQLQELSNSMARIEGHLINKPEQSFSTYAGLFLSILTILGGLIWGMTNYIDLTLHPVRNNIENLIDKQAMFSEFRYQTHYEFGMLHEWQKDTKGELLHNHERMHSAQEERISNSKSIRGLESKVGDIEGEIVRIDSHGSRRWISDSAPNK